MPNEKGICLLRVILCQYIPNAPVVAGDQLSSCVVTYCGYSQWSEAGGIQESAM